MNIKTALNAILLIFDLQSDLIIIVLNVGVNKKFCFPKAGQCTPVSGKKPILNSRFFAGHYCLVISLWQNAQISIAVFVSNLNSRIQLEACGSWHPVQESSLLSLKGSFLPDRGWLIFP
jgi:hypothetical protein